VYINDALGSWEEIGTLQVTDNWQLFNSSLLGVAELRFTYMTDWFNWNDYYGNRSYGLIRFYYPTPEITVSRNYKLYPKQEQEIFKFDTPLDSFKDLGIKRIHYPKFKGYYSAIPLPWSVKVEQKIG
jgi:hypothetical protein